jgi:hypothetical protein
VFGSLSLHGKAPPKATVRATWIEVVSGSERAVRPRQHALESDADSSGNYALCGVPSSANISIRAGSAGTIVSTEVSPLGPAKIARRDITLNVVAQAVRLELAAPERLAFTGRVQTSAGEPLAEAEILMPSVNLAATSNARGEFRIEGVPPGVHSVQVRKIGYSFDQRQLEFVSANVDRTFTGERITLLDSLVRTERSYRDPNLDEFEERRRIGRGRFITRAEIASREGALLGSFMLQIPNLSVHSAAGGEYVMSKSARCHERPPTRFRPRSGALCSIFYVPSDVEAASGVPIGCFAKVYLDNALMNSGTPTPPFNLRSLPPPSVEAMEVYSRSAEVPPKYAHLNSGCGVVVIHTRRPK